jgi:hypothetical protein
MAKRISVSWVSALSSDGQTFTAAATVDTGVRYFFGGGDTIYVYTKTNRSQFVSRSRDHGATFAYDPLTSDSLFVGPFAIFGPDDHTLVGASCVTRGSCRFFRSDDAGDTFSTTPVGSGAGSVEVSPSINDTVTRSRIAHSHDRGQTFAESTPVDATFEALWAAASGDVYAVGGLGQVAHDDGRGSFTLTAVPTSANLHAVWGSAGDDVYAVGDAGTILHYHR